MRILTVLLLLSVNAFAQSLFPDGTFSEFVTRWYTEQMTALGEKPIYAKDANSGHNVYRFTWLRTFHPPVSFELEVLPDGTGNLHLRITDGAGGYAPGKLVRDESKKLTPESVLSLVAPFNTAKFFELPTRSENRGLDGSEWILEAQVDGKYHVTSYWSPSDGPAYHIGMQFIKFDSANDYTPIY